MSLGVFDPAGLVRAAVAELSPRVRPGTAAAGGIHVLSGERGWVDTAIAGARSGARAMIVIEPVPASEEEHERMARIEVPVIASRSCLRPDVVADARSPESARLVVVDGHAPREEARATVRDAVGWARELTGGLLRVKSSARTGRAVIGALSGGAVDVSVTVGLGAAGSAAWMDLDVIAATRVRVRVAPSSLAREVVHTAAGGRLVRPYRYESVERVALRRALDCLESGAADDRADLRADDLVAAELVDGMWP